MLLIAAAAVLSVMAARDLRAVRADLLSARSTLEGAVVDPSSLRTPERRSATEAQLRAAVDKLTGARQRVLRSPGLTVARFLPFLARQRGGLIEVIDDSRTGATAGLRLLGAVGGLADEVQIREGTFPFASFDALALEIRVAGQSVGSAVRSPSGLVGPLGQARRKLNEVAGSASSRLLDGADALSAFPTFLGSEGDRRYLIAMQNNAEMRDQGMILSYAVARFSDGSLTFERSGNIGELQLTGPVPEQLPAGTNEVFGFILPNQLWQSVNASADFAWSARTMAAMYQQATGEPVDGVIAIDVPGLAALLRVVGAVQVDSIDEPLTADNLSRILLHDLYEGLEPIDAQGPRRERLADVVQEVIGTLTSGTRDTIGLGRELGEAAAGGHFRLWSQRTAEEEIFERTGLGGGPATTMADRTFHLAVENRTATKLDYYVEPSVRLEIHLDDNGDARVRTVVTLDNTAPSGPPSYQLGPDEFMTRPGEYNGWFLLWSPIGSQQALAYPESGLMLSETSGIVQAGEQVTAVFETVIPQAVRDGRLTLRLVPQPRLKPMALDVRVVESTGWKVAGPTSWAGPWDRTKTLSWQVAR